MNRSQILLLAAMVLFGLYSFRLRTAARDRITYFVLAILGFTLVIHPEWSNAMARQVGIGRGADLMFYFFIIFSLFHFASSAATIRRMHRDITVLTRELALLRGARRDLHVSDASTNSATTDSISTPPASNRATRA